MYKNNFVDPAFIPGGGAWQDYSLQNEFHRRSGFYVKSQLQYERISHYPLLFNGRQQNVTAIFEFGFTPGNKKREQQSNNADARTSNPLSRPAFAKQ
jgi:hypothetical protein